MIKLTVISDNNVVKLKPIEEGKISTIAVPEVITVINYYGVFGAEWDANTSIGNVYRIIKNSLGQIISKAIAVGITWSQRLTATYTLI